MISWIRWLPAVACCAALVADVAPISCANDVLVADRLSDNVYRYSASGTLLGTVLPVGDDVDPLLQLNQPVGLALSPDLRHLYVSSFQNARVIRYDYDYATGTAAAGVIFADESAGLSSPNDILFSGDGGTIYVSNLGDSGVARFRPDGSSAGPPLQFAPPHDVTLSQFSGLAWAPNGDLLVGAFLDFPAGANGAVGRWTPTMDAMEVFIGPSPSLSGASGLLVHENDLYVTGMFASNLQRFDVESGARDEEFLVGGLAFPQGLMASPDGNGMLAGILGYSNGQGHIAHYDFEGNLVGDGVFASTGGGGFIEGTAFITVPDLPGDFNGDGLVDGADLRDPVDGWMARFGVDLDGNHLLAWQRHITPAPQPEVKSVPEPAVPALVFASLALLRRGRPRPRTASTLHRRYFKLERV